MNIQRKLTAVSMASSLPNKKRVACDQLLNRAPGELRVTSYGLSSSLCLGQTPRAPHPAAGSAWSQPYSTCLGCGRRNTSTPNDKVPPSTSTTDLHQINLLKMGNGTTLLKPLCCCDVLFSLLLQHFVGAGLASTLFRTIGTLEGRRAAGCKACHREPEGTLGRSRTQPKMCC